MKKIAHWFPSTELRTIESGHCSYNRSLTVAAPFRGGAATVRERL